MWKNFDDLEESITLDELFELYDKTGERQQRLLKAVVIAMGGEWNDSPSKGKKPTTPLDQIPEKAMKDGNVAVSYDEGPIISPGRGGGQTLFGYKKVDTLD